MPEIGMNLSAEPKKHETQEKSAEEQKKNKRFLFEVISQVEHFQGGTHQYYRDYKRPEIICKRFIPFFPFLYEDLKTGRSIRSVQFQMLNPPMR